MKEEIFKSTIGPVTKEDVMSEICNMDRTSNGNVVTLSATLKNGFVITESTVMCGYLFPGDTSSYTKENEYAIEKCMESIYNKVYRLLMFRVYDNIVKENDSLIDDEDREVPEHPYGGGGVIFKMTDKDDERIPPFVQRMIVGYNQLAERMESIHGFQSESNKVYMDLPDHVKQLMRIEQESMETYLDALSKRIDYFLKKEGII